MATKQDILNLHFMHARCQLIDIAAFLDRVERHPGEADFRLDALRAALPLLLERKPGRAKAVLEAFSDHSSEPIPAAPMQGALGAPQA